MFHVYSIDPCSQQPRRRPNCHPCFVDRAPQSQPQMGFWPSHVGLGLGCPPSDFEHVNDMRSSIENLMLSFGWSQNPTSQGQTKGTGEVKEERKDGQQRNNCENGCPKNESCKKMPKRACPLQPVFKDLLNNTLASLDLPLDPQESPKWKQTVDCRGFESRNIRVKIEPQALILKAFKKEESEHGVRTSSMKKSVPLPVNVDRQKITCKLSPNQTLFIEAPYLGNQNGKSRKDVLKEVMSIVLPGLEEFFGQNSTGTEAGNKNEEASGKGDAKPNDDKEEEKTETKKENMASMEKPTDQEEPGNKQDKDAHERDEKSADDEKFVAEESDVLTTEAHHDNKGDVSGLNELAVGEETHKVTSTIEHGEPGSEFSAGQKDKDSDIVDQTQHPEAHADDGASNSSDDSFVLLSELEKETRKNDASSTTVNDSRLKIDTGDVLNNEMMNGSVAVVDDGDNENTSPVSEPNVTAPETSHDTTNNSDNSVNVIFRLEMPSYNPESIKVDFDDSKRLLKVTASKDHRHGSPSDSITKSVVVDDDVDVNGLQCYFRDGTLSVTAPRRKFVRSIPVFA